MSAREIRYLGGNAYDCVAFLKPRSAKSLCQTLEELDSNYGGANARKSALLGKLKNLPMITLHETDALEKARNTIKEIVAFYGSGQQLRSTFEQDALLSNLNYSADAQMAADFFLAMRHQAEFDLHTWFDWVESQLNLIRAKSCRKLAQYKSAAKPIMFNSADHHPLGDDGGNEESLTSQRMESLLRQLLEKLEFLCANINSPQQIDMKL